MVRCGRACPELRVSWEHGTSRVKTQTVLDKPGHQSPWMWDVGGFWQGLAVFRDLYAAWFRAWPVKAEHWPAFLWGAATVLSTASPAPGSLKPLAPSFCLSTFSIKLLWKVKDTRIILSATMVHLGLWREHPGDDFSKVLPPHPSFLGKESSAPSTL